METYEVLNFNKESQGCSFQVLQCLKFIVERVSKETGI